MYTSKAIIKTRNLKKLYFTDEIETTALGCVNLEIVEGEFVAIMGPSGCGKSSLLNVIGLLDDVSEGELYFSDEEVSSYSEQKITELRKATIGFVFQSFNLIDELTTFENIELPLIYLNYSKAERRKRVNEVMDQMKISHLKGHFPSQLSGGQQQRVTISRALMTMPKIIFADEPTGDLDAVTGGQIMDIFEELRKDGVTIVMVTHDESVGKRSDRIIRMLDGKVIV